MNKQKPFYKQLSFLIIIFLFLFSFAAVIPFSAKVENTYIQADYLPTTGNNMITLFILGIINIDDLTMWVLGVDRRLVVLKMMHEKRLMKASDIADSTERSLQNISYAMRELEEQGLIRCLTPSKHTWKKYIPTEKGTEVFENLKKNYLIGR